MRPRKRFGQHFLESAWVAKLVAAVAPQPTDDILEIGPGRGALTRPLAARAGRVLAVEVDRDLARALTDGGLPNVTVVTGDVLEVDLVNLARDTFSRPERPAEHVRVVGNLPYNISSPILIRLLAAAETGLFADATLMLQKEVADRLVAKPGTGEYGVLTVTVALGADVTEVLHLPPGAFRPAPKVRSTVVRLVFRDPPPEVSDRRLVVALVRAVFTQRRKTMANALAPLATARSAAASAVLHAAGIDPRRRPETLSLPEFAMLARALDQATPHG
jgi:16S rRNA (adenine1518-N6/adenine1519-N6)-dimethyltransferase